MQALARRLATVVRRPWPDRPIPIAMVITDLDVGGAERALVALATGLDQRRWRPSVIALGSKETLAGPLRAVGIEPAFLHVDRKRPAQAVQRLAKEFQRVAPELVQSFMFHANVASRLAGPWGGRPWVVGGIRVAEHQKRWHLLLDRATSRMATGAVCVSRGVFRFTQDVGGVDPERLWVIPNGIEPGTYDQAEARARAEIGVPDQAHLAICVGRFDVQKGLPYLLDAAEGIVAERPDWHLALAGDGPERERLNERVSQSSALAGRVHWLGRRNDVPALLKTADVLVLPSLWEGMPNVVLEAMAARRAVIATNVEGSEELIVEGETGWLVPPRDPPALLRALREAAEDPERRRRYGEAGRARVEASFSIGHTIAAYETLWAGILGYALEGESAAL